MKKQAIYPQWLLATAMLTYLTFAHDSTAQSAIPMPDIKTWTLDNGLEVVYLGVHAAPIVTVQVWYHAGSKDEARNRRGSAHMFEHIMFKGTRNVPPEEHARLIDKLGGEVNAFTTEDMTAYHDTVPNQYMDFAMELEAERMQNLLFFEGTISTEREVVKEEIRQVENDPIQSALMRFREMAFTTHPYAWDAGGRIEDLDNTTPADLEKFYQTYYVPNNAMLLVVGDVSEEDVRANAKQYFGNIPKGKMPPRPAKQAPEPVQKELRREVLDPAQLGIIVGGYKVPEGAHPDMAALQVLNEILSTGESSRLNQRIVRKDKLGIYAGSFLQQFEDPGLMLVYGVFLSNEQTAGLEEALIDEVLRIGVSGVNEDEVQKAKNQLASQFVSKLEKVSGLGFEIGMSRFLAGDPTHFVAEYDSLLAVTPKEVQRVAKSYLTKERLTLVIVPPKEQVPPQGPVQGGVQ